MDLKENKYRYLLVLSSILTISAFVNLVFRVHITKDTEHLTYLWAILNLCAQMMILSYGFLNKVHEMYIMSFVFILGIVYILYTKVIHEETKQIEQKLANKNIIVG